MSEADKRGWLLIKLQILTVLALVLAGCVGALVGKNEQTRIQTIERYDPETGRPLKVCEILDDRPIEVKFLDENGNPIIKKQKLSGGMYTPPPLPKPAEPAK